ncbi:MAG: hypothetical protein MZV65_46990 [Chromatiales bacterium]|nr:hypothetical protein [Chromatiales bacterium]
MLGETLKDLGSRRRGQVRARRRQGSRSSRSSSCSGVDSILGPEMKSHRGGHGHRQRTTARPCTRP